MSYARGTHSTQEGSMTDELNHNLYRGLDVAVGNHTTSDQYIDERAGRKHSAHGRGLDPQSNPYRRLVERAYASRNGNGFAIVTTTQGWGTAE
jgi:hypothetical protein